MRERGRLKEKKFNLVRKQFKCLISKRKKPEQVVYYSARDLQMGVSAYC